MCHVFIGLTYVDNKTCYYFFFLAKDLTKNLTDNLFIREFISDRHGSEVQNYNILKFFFF
jgi:hypothetical protein